jgi:hypothetical protein
MSAPWVAADVRAVAMSRRRLGGTGVRAIAGSGSLADALTRLAASPYAREISSAQNLAGAQRSVAAAMLWNVRVLAGWAPPAGVAMLRIAVAWFEIVNIEARLGHSETGTLAETSEADTRSFDLGGLATSWRQLAEVSTATEMRERLETTPWGKVDGDSPREIGLVLRSRLIERAWTGIPGAGPWAAGMAALITAREQLLWRRQLPQQVRRTCARILGEPALDAQSLPALRERLPATAQWVLAGVKAPEELWLAESQWWSRVERDGYALLRRAAFGPEPVIGAVAVMAADAWRTRAALEVAARGGRGQEDFDALA